MKLQIIVGTTRPGRLTPLLAQWIANEAKVLPDTEVELVDLVDYPLPFINEEISPRYNPDRHPSEAVQKWISKIAEGDAYIYVTPEYNHSIGGELKNAIDYLTFEMVHKPATVAAHGTVGGARAVMHLKEILSESKAAIIPLAVTFPGRVSEHIDEDGVLSEELKANPYGPLTSLQAVLADLKWYSDALAAAQQAE
jgi:NAD(P)H-dependent FMN reductase